MENNKKYCSICGKEKPTHYIEFINEYVYVNCACEEKKQKEENEKKRKKAIETYIYQRAKNSHIQLREMDADLDTLTVDKNNENAIEIARIIADMLLSDQEREEGNEKNGLILKGNRGSGKTYIACAIINEYNKKHPLNEDAISKLIKDRDNGFINSLDTSVSSPCKIIKEDDLIRLYGRYDYRTDVTPLDEFRKAKKLLVIDDMGTVTTDPKKIQSAYFNIIDYRYSNKLPIIITTNMNNSELKTYLGERTYDRLNACCFSINLTSEESRR